MPERKVIQGRDRGGEIWITCPKCRRDQRLIQGGEWYDVDHKGRVDPYWVCMGHNEQFSNRGGGICMAEYELTLRVVAA